MPGTVIGIIPHPADPTRIGKVIIRTGTSSLELDASLVIGTSSACSLFTLITPALDCTGLTRGGLKWLERAGYGDGVGRRSYKDLKISYNHNLHYTTQIYSLTPELIEKIPIPRGLANATAIYGFHEDETSMGRRLFIMGKPEGDRCLCARRVYPFACIECFILVLLFSGHSGHGTSPSSSKEMRRYLEKLQAFTGISFPEYIFQTIDMLQEVQESMKESHVRVRKSLPSLPRVHVL
jgi:hypothetical protein